MSQELNWQLDDDALVKGVAAMPDGTDFGTVPFVTDLKLGHNGAPREPDRVWRIFEEAAKHPDASVWVANMCTVHRVDALRRDPTNPAGPLLREINTVVERVLAAEACGPAEYFTVGEAGYNGGLLYRMLRRYSEASAAQQRAALWYSAAGRPDKAAISIFLAAVEHASAALVMGGPQFIHAALDHLRQTRAVVERTVQPVPTWFTPKGGGNTVLHVAWAHLMAGVDYPERDADVSIIMGQLAPAAGSPPNHWHNLFQVVEEYRGGYPTTVVNKSDDSLALLADVKSSSIGNVLLTLRWLRAMALAKRGKVSEARVELTGLMAWDGPDGGVPMAVARRTYEAFAAC